MNVNHWLNRQLTDPKDTRLLALLRIVAGLFMFMHYGRRYAFYLHYPDAAGMLLGFTFTFLLFMMIVGLYSRVASVLNGIIMVTLYFDQTFRWFNLPGKFEPSGSWGYESALYFAGLLSILIGLGPCGHSFSIDRLLFRLPVKAPTWNMPLIRFLVASVYFWTAIAKINPGFMQGEVMKQTFILFYSGSGGYHPPALIAASLAFLSKLVPIFELLLGAALLYVPTRLYAVGAGLVFHIFLCLSLPVVGLSVGIIVAYIAFLPHEKVFGESAGG